MCGIVGAFLREGTVVETLIEGLRTLEYRGYDSSGVGVVDPSGDVVIRRKMGRLAELEKSIEDGALTAASIGVGHTRWATHGEPSDGNAHPHTDGTPRLALVHNGIIENHLELRRELEQAGHRLASETDSEVLAHLIGSELTAGHDALEAVRRALGRVDGYYAMALVTGGDQPQLVCARHGPPLCVGATEDGAFLGSDVLALLPHTKSVHYLEDGDIARLSPGSIEVVDSMGQPVDRPAREVEWEAESVDKAGFPHFMLKEIHEQPAVLARTIGQRLNGEQGDVDFGAGWTDAELGGIRRLQIIACGTALHAGYIARYMIEGLAGLPVDIDYASEFRYRSPLIADGTLALAISQSGETADTLAALRLAGSLGARTGCICNVQGSSMVRESDATILTEAGPEIGVASTKAFVAQVVAAYLLAVRLGRVTGRIDAAAGKQLLDDVRGLRVKLESQLKQEAIDAVHRIAAKHLNAKGFLFLGRGVNYPVALEGALKLKEISYVHAEGYPAGEMKHGPIALIEPSMSIVVVNSEGRVSDKVRSNIEQVKARGGKVIAIGSDEESLGMTVDSIRVPTTSEWLSPILNVVPLQLLSYYIADMRGCDIDKPRNLAKSVTVE